VAHVPCMAYHDAKMTHKYLFKTKQNVFLLFKYFWCSFYFI